MVKSRPLVFISYSRDSEIHINWVLEFAALLQKVGGIKVIIDQIDYTRKASINTFILKSIYACDYVLIICTPSYKNKAEALTGDTYVGVEAIINLGLFYKNPEKFIPINREKLPDGSSSVPSFLNDFVYYDFTDSQDQQKSFNDLINEIWGAKEYALPEISSPPDLTPVLIDKNTNRFECLLKSNLKLIKKQFYLYFSDENKASPKRIPFITPIISNLTIKSEANHALGVTLDLKKFISSANKKHLILLGDYGCGKSALMHKVCIDEFVNKFTKFYPILLTVRYNPVFNLDNMEDWFNTLLNIKQGNSSNYLYSWGTDIPQLKKFMVRNDVLLIIDGLDESYIGGEITPEKNYEVLIDYLDTLPCKSIITSRTSYFKRIYNINTKKTPPPFSTINNDYIIEKIENIEIGMINEFTKEDIYKYIVSMNKNKNYISIFMENIRNNSKISQIASKPIFMSMLIKYDIDYIKNDFLLTKMFEDIIYGWITTGRDTSELSKKEILFFLEQLAFYMFISNNRNINIDNLVKYLYQFFGKKIDINKAIQEVTTSSFLVKTTDRNFSFSHNVFMEFMVSSKIFKELLKYNNKYIYIQLLTDPINQFLLSFIEKYDLNFEYTKNIDDMVFIEHDKNHDDLINKKVNDYYIDKYPVTNKSYQEYLVNNPNIIAPTSEGEDLLFELGKRKNIDWFVSDVQGYLQACQRFCWNQEQKSFPLNTSDFPVFYVSYYDAWNYARWNGKLLPTLYEWNKAAAWNREKNTFYKYGIIKNNKEQIPSKTNNNFDGDFGEPTSVFRFNAKSPYGCIDMLGNVSEWTNTWFDEECWYLTIVGGSWHMPITSLEISNNSYSFPNLRRNFIGFRCITRQHGLNTNPNKTFEGTN